MNKTQKDSTRLTHLIDQVIPAVSDTAEKALSEMPDEIKATMFRAFTAVSQLPKDKYKEKFEILYEKYCLIGADFPPPLLTCIVGAMFDVLEPDDAAGIMKEVFGLED